MHAAAAPGGGLSTNHRADYLRSYFMHHFGGGHAACRASRTKRRTKRASRPKNCSRADEAIIGTP